MNQISLYLSKYKHLGLEERLVKDIVLDVLKNNFGFNLEPEKISFKNANLNIMVAGPMKTEIILNKEKILDTLNISLSKLNSKIKKVT